MKKSIYLIVVIGALALIVAGCGLLTVPPAEQNELDSIVNKTVVNEGEYTDNIVKDAHKIKNKWDLKGSFVAHSGYNWGTLAEGATWEYSIHIKEAIDGDCSVGSIRFTTTTGDIIEVIGHVKQTKSSYNYSLWAGWDTLAAAGMAEYNGETYNFLFLFSEYAMWFAISHTELDSYWASDSVWQGTDREYDLMSKLQLPDTVFTVDPKKIH